MVKVKVRSRFYVWSAITLLLVAAVVVTLVVSASSTGTAGADRAARPATTFRPRAVAPARRAASTPVRWSVLASGGEVMGVTADVNGVIAVSYREVQSLDPTDGSMRWHTAIGRTPDIAPVRAAIDAEVVAVPTSAGIAVLSRADGKPRWESGYGDAAGDAGPVALASTPDGTQLVVGTTEDGTVAAFDRATGAMRWKVDFPGSIVTAPQIDASAGIAAVAWHADGADGQVRALDLATGATRWEVSTMEKLAAPVAHAGLVVLSEGDNHSHARIRALDAGTGAPRWEAAAPKSFEWETEPAAEGDDYVTVDHFGTVTAVDLRSGEVRWRHSEDWALIDTQILLTGRSVAFHDFHDDVVVLDRSTGDVRSVTRPAGAVVDTAATDGAVVTAVGGLAARRFEARPVP